jgi:hypothetical protein
MGESVEQGHKSASGQRRQAIITGVVLAVMALAVYGVVILKYVTNPS